MYKVLIKLHQIEINYRCRAITCIKLFKCIYFYHVNGDINDSKHNHNRYQPLSPQASNINSNTNCNGQELLLCSPCYPYKNV